MKASKIVSGAACVAVAFAGPLRHHRSMMSFGRLVVFGDSFSDNGNGAWVYSNKKWPNDPAYYNHSFSNGPTWNDVLAQRLNISVVNLAIGGSTSDNSFVPGYTGADNTILVPGAKQQIEKFLREDGVRRDDLYVHWTGANDIFFNSKIVGQQVASVVVQNVDILFRAGARTILLPTYPSLDLLPATFPASVYGNFTHSYTASLSRIIASYSAYVNIVLVDVGALFASIYASPGAYGLDPAVLYPPSACLKGIYASEKEERSLCGEPEKYLWFDVFHPVSEVNERIAGLFERVLREL